MMVERNIDFLLRKYFRVINGRMRDTRMTRFTMGQAAKTVGGTARGMRGKFDPLTGAYIEHQTEKDQKIGTNTL